MYEGTAAGHTSIVTGTDAVLSDVFATHSDRLTRFVYSQLFTPDWHLAEDLASETFLELVRSYSGRLVDLDRVGGLLRTIARRAISDHFRVLRSTESPTDFGDWFEARRLPASLPAEDHAIAHLTVRARLADSEGSLGVAA